VVLVPNFVELGADNGPMGAGTVGVITADDGSEMPFQVCCAVLCCVVLLLCAVVVLLW
jgi:hypothetical protein